MLRQVLLVLSGAFLAALSSARRQGFVGVYHAAPGNVADGLNTSAYAAGEWGIVAPINAPDDGGLAFQEDIKFHCDQADINALYGMLIAQSEGGVFNNTNDTDLWHPLPHSRTPSPRGAAGLLQGAARWSTLAKDHCPQIGGVVIDDFWSNFDDQAPPVPPSGECARCPANQSNMYGSLTAGFYCCEWLPAGGHCTPPPGAQWSNPCCLTPGTARGCQGEGKCPGNPVNSTPCNVAMPLNLPQMKDIKAALMGKTVTPDGRVLHDSTPTTPFLKLFVVTYQSQIRKLDAQPLLDENIIDGVSFWISGPAQNANVTNVSSYVSAIRKLVGPTLPVFTGAYITYSSIGWVHPEPFYNILDQSLALYDKGLVQGFYVFAGTALSQMNASQWSTWNLTDKLDRHYQPWLGSAHVTAVDASTRTVLQHAVGTVKYRDATHVTRKVVGQSGFSLSGWVGKEHAAPHTLVLEAAGFETQKVPLQLVAGSTLPIVVDMSPRYCPDANWTVQSCNWTVPAHCEVEMFLTSWEPGVVLPQLSLPPGLLKPTDVWSAQFSSWEEVNTNESINATVRLAAYMTTNWGANFYTNRSDNQIDWSTVKASCGKLNILCGQEPYTPEGPCGKHAF